MNPTYELKREHDAMTIVLDAMKRRANNIREQNKIDLFRIGQIIGFLWTYIDQCHHKKEEKILFPALLECEIPWATDTIHQLVKSHRLAHGFLKEIDDKFRDYLAGRTQTLDRLPSSMFKFISLEENHIKTVNEILLPFCDKVLNQNQQKNISLNFRRIQDHQVAHYKHLEYYLLLNKLYSETKIALVSDFFLV